MALKRIETIRPIHGFASMQVCAESDVKDEEIFAFCNRDNPAGTENGWSVVDHTEKRGPVPCETHDGRLHFVVDC